MIKASSNFSFKKYMLLEFTINKNKNKSDNGTKHQTNRSLNSTKS